MEGVAAVLLGPHAPALALLCGATEATNFHLADELLHLAQVEVRAVCGSYVELQKLLVWLWLGFDSDIGCLLAALV